MKLIIDIPEEQKRMVDMMLDIPPQVENDLISAIRNGTPLDDVNAEIETDLSFDMFDEYGNETRLHKDLMNILDNIGNAESED